jgi:hypothetical protein
MHAGLRRVGAAGLADQHGGEERGAQPVAGRVRCDRRGEGRAGGGVPRGRLLRRHRRARRQGLRLLPGTLRTPSIDLSYCLFALPAPAP